MQKKTKLQIIPLGGLGEVGRNMTVLEWDKKIIIIDIGVGFPEEGTPGIDYLIPNTNYLQKRKKDILGIVFTHGHYDHIGAVPYVLDRLGNPPMFASSLTREIILNREQEFPHRSKPKITKVKNGTEIVLGPFRITFFHQNHNIPGNLGLFIKTPIGNILHTSDFKFDKTPVNEEPSDFEKLKDFGRKGIVLLMSGSTNSEVKGHSFSEELINKNLDKLIRSAEKRIVISTFSSLLNRVQQIITCSEEHGRKVIIRGRSMQENIEIAQRLKYLKVKKGTFVKSKDFSKYPPNKITVICTGSQAEDQAALMRISNNEDKFIKLTPGDTVILSSSIIPGNEVSVQHLKDRLYQAKLNVINYSMMDIHAGGHAQQDELRQMINLIKPKFLMPIHGYVSMLITHKKIAIEEGIPAENIIVTENGKIIEMDSKELAISKETVPANVILVDGLGIGDIGEVVLRDRKNLAKDGMFVLIVAVDRKTGKVQNSPDIISRGFIYLKQSQKLLNDVRKEVIKIVNKSCQNKMLLDSAYIKDNIRNEIGLFLFQKTRRRPMVLPVIIEI